MDPSPDNELTDNATPPKRPRGAPIGSKNALRHGKRTQKFRFGLALGALPKGAIHIQRAGNKFRQYLEAAIIDAHGEVTIERAAVVHACCNWMQAEALAWLWLRKHSGDKKNPMSHSERLAYVQACAKASSEVVRHIAMLRLNPATSDTAGLLCNPESRKTLLGSLCDDGDDGDDADDGDDDRAQSAEPAETADDATPPNTDAEPAAEPDAEPDACRQPTAPAGNLDSAGVDPAPDP